MSAEGESLQGKLRRKFDNILSVVFCCQLWRDAQNMQREPSCYDPEANFSLENISFVRQPKMERHNIGNLRYFTPTEK